MAAAASPQVIRKFRHWKQRFDPKAKMVWRKRVRWPNTEKTKPGKPADGLVTFEPGTEVPAWVIKSMGGAKLRNLWESGRIELLGFKGPNVRTGVVDPVPEPQAPEPTQAAAPQAPSSNRKKKTTTRKKATSRTAATRSE
jgi:hypothetical protein